MGPSKNSLYVSLLGYGLVCSGLCTQGGALPFDRLRAKLTLGCSMKPLRGKRHEGNTWLFQQRHVHLHVRGNKTAGLVSKE